MFRKPIILCLLTVSAATQALQEDWQQEMTILSDRAEIDRRAGTVIYEGKVVLTQGTLRIEADRLLILQNDDTLEKAVAEGNPAQYQQQIEPGKPVTHAHGNRIDYYTGERRITLRGEAELSQDGNLFSGELITYDMATETVKASGNKATSGQIGEKTADGRIRVVIQPQKPAEGQ